MIELPWLLPQKPHCVLQNLLPTSTSVSWHSKLHVKYNITSYILVHKLWKTSTRFTDFIDCQEQIIKHMPNSFPLLQDWTFYFLQIQAAIFLKKFKQATAHTHWFRSRLSVLQQKSTYTISNMKLIEFRNISFMMHDTSWDYRNYIINKPGYRI